MRSEKANFYSWDKASVAVAAAKKEEEVARKLHYFKESSTDIILHPARLHFYLSQSEKEKRIYAFTKAAAEAASIEMLGKWKYLKSRA